MNLKMPLLIFKDLCILRFMGAMRVYGRGSLILCSLCGKNVPYGTFFPPR